MSTAEQHRALVEALVTDKEKRHLYFTSAEFKQGVDLVVWMMPRFIDLMADDARRHQQVRAEMERALRSPAVERVDKYNIVVDGVTVRATEDQEARIREMSAEERARFVKIMGRKDQS